MEEKKKKKKSTTKEEVVVSGPAGEAFWKEGDTVTLTDPLEILNHGPSITETEAMLHKVPERYRSIVLERIPGDLLADFITLFGRFEKSTAGMAYEISHVIDSFLMDHPNHV